MQLRKTALNCFYLAALLSFAALHARAQDAVIDGGFESGSFALAWTNVDPSAFSGVDGNPDFASSGDHYAYLGATPQPGALSQSLITTPGEFYTLSFSLANDSGVPPNYFQVLFDGNIVLTLTNSPASGYTLFSIPNLLATTASTSLEFRYRNDDDYFRLDDVSATVPEPSTLWLIGPAFAVLLMRARRSKSVRA